MIRTNKQGQSLGPKGVLTRTSLLDAARMVLSDPDVKTPTPSAIARAAGLSAQTFYLYFTDFDELLLVLAEEANRDMADLIYVLSLHWPRDALFNHCREFVDLYYDFWARNRPAMIQRNFKAESGDERFIEACELSARPIVRAIARKMLESRPRLARTETEALSTAIMFFAGLERLAARPPELHHKPSAFISEDFKKAQASMLSLLIMPELLQSQLNEAEETGRAANVGATD